MLDRFNRHINYLRISVTDRCNLRCRYCMPADGIPLISHNEVLSFEEIRDFTQVAVDMGIDKVRLTGGEPLVRKGIISLVQMLAGIPGIKDLAMTTNGILLKKYAKPLANAGLHRVNISLDALNSKDYRHITRGGKLQDALDGIFAARDAGLEPIKINCVVKYSSGEKHAVEVTRFCMENNLQIRYITEMDLEKGSFSAVQGGEGGNCTTCNRLRLSADGKVKPCLFSDLEFDVRKLGSRKALEQALSNKPRSGTHSLKNKFSQIGG